MAGESAGNIKNMKHQFLVDVSGKGVIWGKFPRASAVSTTAATTDIWNAGSTSPYVVSAQPVHGEMTLTRDFERGRDLPLYRYVVDKVGKYRLTVTKTPTDIDLVAKGSPPIVYSCLVIGVTDPEVQAGAQTDTSDFVITCRVFDIS